jgi:CheY-like chemotaxis protein
MAHILVAEDERDIRELINFTLMFAGHTVTLAANGEEAVELARQSLTNAAKPDLIMMDVRMPKMTGYEACRQIKLLDGLKDVPVVFLSAKGQDEEIQTGLDAGAAAYILKPFAPDDLTRRVGELLVSLKSATPEGSSKTTESAGESTPESSTPASESTSKSSTAADSGSTITSGDSTTTTA